MASSGWLRVLYTIWSFEVTVGILYFRGLGLAQGCVKERLKLCFFMGILTLLLHAFCTSDLSTRKRYLETQYYIYLIQFWCLVQYDSNCLECCDSNDGVVLRVDIAEYA